MRPFFVLINMTKIELPEGIFERVMAHIRLEQRFLTIKRRLMIFSFGFVGSAIALVPVFKLTQSSFAESGFLHFISLIFSDFGITVSYWQSFAMSLLETLPAMSLAILLAVIFIFLESLRFLARDIKFIFPPKKLIIS